MSPLTSVSSLICAGVSHVERTTSPGRVNELSVPTATPLGWMSRRDVLCVSDLPRLACRRDELQVLRPFALDGEIHAADDRPLQFLRRAIHVEQKSTDPVPSMFIRPLRVHPAWCSRRSP
jgi:hypothetical protein